MISHSRSRSSILIGTSDSRREPRKDIEKRDAERVDSLESDGLSQHDDSGLLIQPHESEEFLYSTNRREHFSPVFELRQFISAQFQILFDTDALKMIVINVELDSHALNNIHTHKSVGRGWEKKNPNNSSVL